MENFKVDLEKNERYYLEIEKENKRLKPYFEKFNQLKTMMEETLEKVRYYHFVYNLTIFKKIERKEKENQKLKALLDETNKQMERFISLTN